MLFLFCRTCLLAPQCQHALTLLHNLWKKHQAWLVVEVPVLPVLPVLPGGGAVSQSVSQSVSPPTLLLRAQLTHSSRPDSSLTSCKQNTGRWGGNLWVRIYWAFMSLHHANRLFFFPMSSIFCNRNMLKCFKKNEQKGKYLPHIDTDVLHIHTNIFTQLFELTGIFCYFIFGLNKPTEKILCLPLLAIRVITQTNVLDRVFVCERSSKYIDYTPSILQL